MCWVNRFVFDCVYRAGQGDSARCRPDRMPRPGQFSAPAVVSQVHFLRQNGNRRRRRLGVHLPEGPQLRSRRRHLQLGGRTRMQRVERSNAADGIWEWEVWCVFVFVCGTTNGRASRVWGERTHGQQKNKHIHTHICGVSQTCPAERPATILISFTRTWVNVSPDGSWDGWWRRCWGQKRCYGATVAGRKRRKLKASTGVDRCGVVCVCVYEYGRSFGLQIRYAVCWKICLMIFCLKYDDIVCQMSASNR